MRRRGFSDLVAVVLLIVVVFVVVTLLFNWALIFVKTNIDELTRDVPTVNKLVEIVDVKYVTPYLKITVYPHAVINVTHIVVLKDDSIVCKKIVNEIIDEPYEELKIRCVLTRGTYVIKLIDNYFKIVAEKTFTIGN